MRKFTLFLFIATIAVSLSVPVFGAGSNDAKALHTITNQYRADAGRTALAWNDDLAAAAEIRAKEISIKYTSDHTRLDGTKYYTVSNLVWGENIAYGYGSAAEVMAAWIRSTGHKRNILKDDYTIFGAAAYELDGTIYWVQVFGNGKDNASWTGNPPMNTAKKAVESVPPQPQQTVTVAESAKETLPPPINAQNSQSNQAAVAGRAYAPLATPTVVVSNGGSPSSQELNDALIKALNTSGTNIPNIRLVGSESIQGSDLVQIGSLLQRNGRSALISADTPDATGSGIQGRIDFYPTDFTNSDAPLELGVRIRGSMVESIRNNLAKYYGNQIAVVAIDHEGYFATSVEVSVRPDLTGMDRGSLFFYSYDRQQNSCTLISNTMHYFDPNGFLHFTTPIGGYILITCQAI